MTHPNSVQAYRDLKQYDDLDQRQRDVYAFVKKYPGMNYRQLTAAMRKNGKQVQESTVSPRLDELKKAGMIYVFDRRPDNKTKRMCNTYAITGMVV